MNTSARPTAQDTAHYRLRSVMDVHLAASDVQRLPSLLHCASVDQSLLATLVSELGSNILKYAGSGHIRVRTTPRGPRVDVEVVAEDQGPGIADVALALQDHYSSSGTLGLGLSGVRRMSSQFHIDSAPGQGCRVTVHKWMAPATHATPTAHDAAARAYAIRPRPQAPATVPAAPPRDHAPVPAPPSGPREKLRFDVAERNRPFPSELVSGDVTVVCPVADGLLLACIDASGHGPRAHSVAQKLSERLRAHAARGTGSDLRRMLQMLHDSAVGTVGAAAALVLLDPERARLRMVGVGNIRVRCVGLQSWIGISRNGMLGERFSLPEEQSCELHPDDLVMLYSDGIREHLDRQLLVRAHLGSAHMLANTLLREGSRTTDDASCVVALCRR